MADFNPSPAAISAGHEVTLESAKIILENGGNAFDAAITAAFTMFITETAMASAGAAGFALVHHQGQTKMLDFFTQTPLAKPILKQRDFYPVHVNFGNEVESFHVGLASSATPGIIRGIFEIYRKYASMPLKDLLEPVKRLAREGVRINTFQDIDLGLLESIFHIDESMRPVFFPKGKRLKENDILYMPNLSSFLDFMEHDQDKGFYDGEIGAKVAQASIERGGYLRRNDFESYQAIWRDPISFPYKDHVIVVPNGPSLGGAILALNLHDRSQNNGWVDTYQNNTSKYETITSIQSEMLKHFPSIDYRPSGGPISTKGTSHFNILDNQGNGISFTCSIGEGCGYFIPGTDMQMNNMMGESFLLPDGFHSWKENSRLNSMMTPTIMTDKHGKLQFLGGSGGAGRIPYMIGQLLDQYLETKDLTQAMHHPRIHLTGNTMHGEKGADLSNLHSKYRVQEWDYESLFFGGVHSIGIQEKKIEAVGDPRRYGVAWIEGEGNII